MDMRERTTFIRVQCIVHIVATNERYNIMELNIISTSLMINCMKTTY